MKVGESFKRAQISEQYDAIIIGSGIGGLSCAALLAKEGKKVLILEKHYVAGGFTHVFKRKDYEWDVGIHYIGEVHRERHFLKDLFADISNNELKWQAMDDVYDKIIFPDREYDLVAGKENFIRQMTEYFPEEGPAIEEYIALVYKAARSVTPFYGARVLPPILGPILRPWLQRKFLNLADRTTLEVLQSLTSNKKLIAVLTGQYGDYGLPPAQSSFAMHAVLVKHYMHGGAYPIGGCERIAQTIAPIIESAGGKIYVNAGVDEIIVKNNIAVGVRMEDGTDIFAPKVVSNAGFINTYDKLISAEVAEKHGAKDKLSKVEPATSHICLYIGLKESTDDLQLGSTNLWIYPGYDHDKNISDFLEDQNAPLPVTYISFPSAKDPDWENRYPGRSTIEIITVAPYEWFEEWEDDRWRKRGAKYEALKEKFAKRMLEQLYKYKPQVKGKIDYYEVSTPLSTKHFVNYQKGEIYGLHHTPERFRLNYLGPRTPIKNLFLTGQDVVSVGVGGALMGGLLTASVITGKNLLNKVKKRAAELNKAVQTHATTQPMG